MDLKEIVIEMRDCLETKRKELNLTFIEDTHTYYMLDTKGKMRSDFPSVSKVYKKFYRPFDSEGKSYQMSKGDAAVQRELLDKWKMSGDYSTNMGSRVHYLLESDIISRYNDYKEVRKPLFECDDTQINKGDKMISAGQSFIDLMHERGAVLLDTEIVVGDPELGYTGQPDKAWLMMNKEKTGFGLVITDWKTNTPKNFEIQPYTDKMLPPFNTYPNTALSHYYIQLPLYGRLLLKMLEHTKFNNIGLLGCVVVLLKENGTFVEYRVPPEVNQTILNLNLKKYI